MENESGTKIVIIGGGFAGLEAAFYLRALLKRKAELTLVCDKDFFLFKPNTIYIPFGFDPEKLKVPLQDALERQAIRFLQAQVLRIDPRERRVECEGGAKLPYDYAVVATGASMRAAEIPGLGEHAYTIWTPEEMLRLRGGFDALIKDAGRGQPRRVVFMVPPNNKCSGPLYEMVMMLDTWLRRKKVRRQVEIAWTTYEQGYIQAFGPRLNEFVESEFKRRGIQGHKQWIVEKVEKGLVCYKNGERLPFDLLVSFPPYVASTPFSGLPTDERGFLKTNVETRQIEGHPNLYAVGDAGDFPVKQAFLAFLQADAAAEHLAAAILHRAPAKKFSPVSMCVMEQFDQATFAQVPLRLTGRPELPVEVDPAAKRLYRVGTSKAWRLGKGLLGVYLPWRFRRGLPFHRGVPWQAMDLGLKAMSRVLAK